MPEIVPVSAFRADIESVGKLTDAGEIVILTQNGKPRWTMVDYDEWNASSKLQEKSFAQSLHETEEKELRGELAYLDEGDFKKRQAARRKPQA